MLVYNAAYAPALNPTWTCAVVDETEHAILDQITEVNGMRHGGRHATSKRFDEGQTCRDSLLLSFRQGQTLHRNPPGRR